MTAQVALLRAVNVAGHGRVAMVALRALAGGLGLGQARTLLNSGNLVFTSRLLPGRIERLLEAELRRTLGAVTDVVVRTRRQWSEIVAANPYPNQAASDPGHLLVMVLKDTPAAAAVAALQAATTGRELVRPGERHLYLVYPDGVGRSRLSAGVIEKALGVRGTARNWNTVMRLCDLLER